MWSASNDFLALGALGAGAYAVASALIVMYYFQKYRNVDSECELSLSTQPKAREQAQVAQMQATQMQVTQIKEGQNPCIQNLEASPFSFSFASLFSPLFLILCIVFFCFCFGLLLVFGFQVGVVVAAALLVLGVIDYRFFALPDVLSFGFLALCVACAFVWSMGAIPSLLSYDVPGFELRIEPILLGFGLGGVAFAFKILYHSLTGRECLGEADILIISGMGVALGAGMAFFALFVGSLCALLYGIAYAYHTQSSLFTLRFPLCPFLCLGVVSTLILLLFLTF